MKIWLDMDGTIADLYGVENWLDYLLNEDATPYTIAEPLVAMGALARWLRQVQRNGVEIGIISWGSKNSTDEYLTNVYWSKRYWLKKHLPSVQFDEIKIVPYGMDKATVCNCRGGDILVDDEEKNRFAWEKAGGVAFHPVSIFTVLTTVAKKTAA